MEIWKNRFRLPVTPLMMLGVLGVLLPLFTYMTLDRMDKQKEFIRERMMARGASLLRTFEAGTRTGMLTMRWGGQRIQAMLLETAAQPDISYIMITDSTGRILAHSDGEKVGTLYPEMPQALLPGEAMSQVLSRTLTYGEEPVFEVYKRFVPLKAGFRGRHGHRMQEMDPQFSGEAGSGMPGGGGMMGGPGFRHQEKAFSRMEEHYIFAGLSMARMTELERQMTRSSIWRGVLFFTIGCAGIIALIAFQAYRSAKASLSRVQAFSDNVVQNMPSGLVTLDREFAVTSANRAARQILGEIPDRGYPQMIQMAESVAREGQSLSRELVLPLSEGRELSLDMTASLIQGEGQGVQGYVFLFRDLTRLRLLLREVETNRRLAAIGKLAGGVAHEIRNPLSSIKGFATYFGTRYQDNEEDAETAAIMVQEVERINRSITQLLEFANPMAVDKKPVEIEPLIRHSLKLVSHDLERNAIRAEVEIQTENRWVSTDPDRLNQVLLNLYMNAVNAMETGGRLTVSVTGLAGTGETAGGVEIRVRDTGCGMDSAILDTIFDPYFTTRPKGTGLGLSIVHRIVENLGGEIRVESEPGTGTCFTLVLAGTAVPEPDTRET